MQQSVKSKVPNDVADWLETAETLGKGFADRAAEHDASGCFVKDNYREMRERRLFSAGIPSALGGGAADYQTWCGIVRTIARHCGSTALAYSMHSHPVAANVFKYLNGDESAGGTLQKLAGGELVIATTGANDWLDSSGDARRVDGGYRVTARKRFVSGVPGAHVFVASAATGETEREVVHFSSPMSTDGIRIVETWDALGMRATGSHDVELENVFVPDSAVVARRPAGEWHAIWNVILGNALPLIVSTYIGLADTAAEIAEQAARRRPGSWASALGALGNELTVARMTHEDMIRLHDEYRFAPTLETADAMLVRKTIATRSVNEVVSLATEIVGGPGFFRGNPIERISRDVRAMHFHPLPRRSQHEFSGRVALGDSLPE